MAKRILSEKHKRVIVQRLAGYETPTQVAKALLEEFGVSITKQGVEFYDPAKNPLLKREWSELFDQERHKFLCAFDKEPLNALNYRQSIRRRVLIAKSGRAPKIELQVLSDASQDYYRHVQQVGRQEMRPSTPSGDGIALPPTPDITTLDRAERIARISQLLARRKEK